MLFSNFDDLCGHIEKRIYERKTFFIGLILVFKVLQLCLLLLLFKIFLHLQTSFSLDFIILDLIRHKLKSVNLFIDQGKVCQTCTKTAVKPYWPLVAGVIIKLDFSCYLHLFFALILQTQKNFV